MNRGLHKLIGAVLCCVLVVGILGCDTGVATWDFLKALADSSHYHRQAHPLGTPSSTIMASELVGGESVVDDEHDLYRADD